MNHHIENLSSPFSKRKNLNNNNNSIQQQQQQTVITNITATVASIQNTASTGIPVKQSINNVSNIPTPKKSFQSFLPTSLLTQNNNKIINNNNNNNNSTSSSNNSINNNNGITSNNIEFTRKQMHQQQINNNNNNNNEYLQTQFASSESSSGISSGSNKTTSNSSRSTSPTNSVESVVTSTTSLTNIEMNKLSIKSSLINSNNKDIHKQQQQQQQQQQQKKSGLPKGVSSTFNKSPTVMYNTPVINNDKCTSSKLQSVSNSNIGSNTNNNTSSDTKIIKKFGTTIKNSFGLSSKSNNNNNNMPNLIQSINHKESLNSLSSTSASSIKSTNNTIKKSSNNNLSNISTSSTCSIPKLQSSKFNDNLKNSLNTSNNDLNNVEANSNTLRKIQQYSIPTSKIPNCTPTIKKSETNQKSINIVKTSTQQQQQQQIIPTENEIQPQLQPQQQQTHKQIAIKAKIPIDSNLMTKSMNSNLPSLNSNIVYTKLPNKLKSPSTSSTQTTPIKKTVEQITPISINIRPDTLTQKLTNDKTTLNGSSNIARVLPFKVDNKIETQITNTPTSIATIPQPITASTPSNEELNDDFFKNNEINEEINLLNDLKIETDKIGNSIELNTCSTEINFNSNGYPSDKDLSTYARKIQKRFKDGMQAVKESMQFALSDEDFVEAQIDNLIDNHNNKNNYILNNNNNMFDKKLLNSPGIKDKQQINQNNLKSISAHLINDLIIQQKNNNNNNTNQQQIIQSNQTKSNTLDRKIRQSIEQYDLNNQNSTSFKLFSSSLERNKHKKLMIYQNHQQQQQQQQIQNNDKSLIYSDNKNINTNLNNKKIKKHINQDTILENPNTIYLSGSNDNLTNSQNAPKILSYNEELLKKEKEIINLKLELENSRNRILTMTNQLNTNAHIVTTLEHNLSSLTLKVQTLSINIQRKDKTINELKGYLEILSNKYPKVFENEKLTTLARHNSTESMASLNSIYSQRSFQSTSEVETNIKKKRNWLRSSFIKAFNRKKKLSSPPDNNDIISETSSNKRYSDIDENNRFIIASQNNNQSLISGTYSLPNSPLHQQMLLNNSNNHLSNSRLSNVMNEEEVEEIQRQLREKESKLTDIQLEALASAHQLDQLKEECIKMRREMNFLKDENIRLKAIINNNNEILDKSLNDDHQNQIIENRISPNKITFNKLTNEQQDNEKEKEKSDKLIKRIEECTNINHEIISQSFKDGDGKRVKISIYYGCENKLDKILSDNNSQVFIGSLSINTHTKWEILDNVVKKLFKEYLIRLDSKNSQQKQTLGLNLDSLNCYFVGDMLRVKDTTQNPDLLPYGYLVGNYTNIIICLKDYAENCLDSLCFETFVPKNILQRYISLLNDYKNLLLCGQTGTGKSFIAKKIGEYLVKTNSNKNNNNEIEYYNVENKSSKDLKKYLNNLIEQSSLPYVIILDNLHNIGNISDAFNQFFINKNSKKLESFIIGTVNHPNITSLNIHENFKWILCVNHAEPVNNYLSRYLERCLIEHEINVSNKCPDLQNIVNFIPKFWSYLNKCIETYNSADVTLGPKLFQNIPLDTKASKCWFFELWNHSLVPYIIETILEGVQVYGTEIKWEDPKIWILDNSPWKLNESEKKNLRSIKASDVGCETENLYDNNVNKIKIETSNDNNNLNDNDFIDNHNMIDRILCPVTSPSKCSTTSKLNDGSDNLINMLMRLQEVTMGNQKRTVSSRLINDTNISLNTNIILPMPKSVESAL